MKTLTLLFTLLSLYLLANQAQSTFNPIRLPTADNAAVASGTAVLDIDGDEIRRGQEYYAVPAVWGAGGGGLKLGKMDSWSVCPSDVIQSQNSFDLGHPMTFTPTDPNATIVSQSSNYIASFDVSTNQVCQDKLSWKIEYDRGSKQYLVKAGEVVENVSSQFKIEVVNSDLKMYKFTYCQYGTNKCYNVGKYNDRSARATRLALSNNPHVVVFQKASDI